MSRSGDGADLNVSRETLDRLRAFEAVLRQWTAKINLVSKSSLDVFWQRHVADSAQLFQCIRPAGHWVDLGSGGGFPGLVVAILAAEAAPDVRLTLIESDQRKAAFLRTAARSAGVDCTVIARRIELADPQGGDIVSARALAGLDTLLGYAERHLASSGTALFPKGVTWKKEMADARERWNFTAEPITSKTEDGAVILKIEGVSRV